MESRLWVKIFRSDTEGQAMTLNQRIDAILRSVYPDVDQSGSVGHFEKVSNLYEALALGRIFWSDVAVIHGAVFVILRENDAREIESRMSARVAAVAGAVNWDLFVDSFNRFEVRHLFLCWPGDREISGEAEFLLAELLVETWSARLKNKFPDREFSVSIEDPVGEEGPCVLISQVNPELAPPEGWMG